MKRATNIPIQSLKGLACITVMLGHVSGSMRCDILERLSKTPFHILMDGQCAVMLFFAITGFFYYKTHEASKFTNIYNWGGGVIHKLLRLFPSFWISITVGWLLSLFTHNYPHELFSEWCNKFWNAPIRWTQYLETMTIIGCRNADLIDPPIWYLCVEFKMLFIMPIVVWLIKRHGWSMATFIFGISLFVPSLPFALGLLFVYLTGYMVRKALVEFPSLAQWIQNCSTLTVVCLVIASLLCLGFYDITQLPEHLSYHGLHGFQALGVMLLLPIVYLRGGRWMYHPILQWLGKVSYQVYLIHFIVMLALRPIALPVPIYIVSVLVITFILAQGMKTVDIWIQSKIEKIL